MKRKTGHKVKELWVSIFNLPVIKRIFRVRWLQNLKIGPKLILGFAIIAIVAGGIGLVGASNIYRISRAGQVVYRENISVLGPLHRISTSLLKVRSDTVYHLLAKQDKFRYEYAIESAKQTINQDLTVLEKSNSNVEQQINSLKNALATYWKTEAVVLKLSKQNRTEEATEEMGKGLNSLSSMIESIINSLFSTSCTEAETQTTANYQAANQTILVMLAMALIALGVALSLGLVIARSISKPMKLLTTAAEQLAVGDVSATIATVSAKDETAILTNAFAKMVDSIREQAEAVAKVAAGDLDVDVEVKSEHDLLAQSLVMEVRILRELAAETGKLTAAASRGQLDVRGDAAKFNGEYNRLITGFNQTLDAVTAPLAEAGTVLGKMAVNDYTVAMEGNYQGVLKDFADRINLVQEHLLGVQELFIRVARGDISLLDEYRSVGKQSENDQLVPAAIMMMEALQGLITETGIVANAAAQGELTVRGDAGKLTGKYQEIVQGINDVLDRMAQPISEALAVLEELAQGNLDRKMAGIYQGDYARLQEALNKTVISFGLIIGEINQAADRVAAAARELSLGSTAVSQGATAQAATVEELSAAVADVAGRVKQNAAQAERTAQLAEVTRENAGRGNQQMQAMLLAMKQINEAADGIAKIIKVIDEIAFQTNILALNAAIEAARAGQTGKGFAVVADEVRNLAGRSAAAAKETEALIESSLRKTGDGMEIANRTAEALNRIAEDISRAADLVADIAEASNGQATSITQINQGINQVAAVTQTTTATSEESASASEALLGQAEELRQLVGRFRLTESRLSG
jgi:methyl-accepting chemotaxis protein